MAKKSKQRAREEQPSSPEVPEVPEVSEVPEAKQPEPDRRQRWIRGLSLSALSGVLYFVGYVGFGQSYLTWLCFLPALVALEGESPKRAFWFGTMLGTVMSIGGFYWVTQLLTQFANLPWPVGVLGLLLLAFQQGVGIGLVTWAVRRLGRDLELSPAVSLPLALTAQELLYPQLFPFYIGASQYRFTMLTQIVEFTGVVGIATLIGLVNGALYELIAARRQRRAIVRRRLVPALLSVVLALSFGAMRLDQVGAAMAAAKKIDVALIQTNLGAKDKHEKAAEFIERHRSMTLEAIAQHPELDLVVWPESAYNAWVPRDVKNLSEPVTHGITTPLLFGALTWDRSAAGDPRGYNSAVLTSSSGAVLGTFDKVVLLMFGETLPLVSTFPSLAKYYPQSSSFTAGTRLKHLRLRDGTALLPMICYEDLIPSFVRDMWHSDGPAEALVNITNDSWYGDSHEPLEHLTLATFRSIETRRALIRATNTGISAVVDPTGKLTARTGQWTQETLLAEVPLMTTPTETFYLRWGDLYGWIIAIALGILLVRAEIVRRASAR